MCHCLTQRGQQPYFYWKHEIQKVSQVALDNSITGFASLCSTELALLQTSLCLRQWNWPTKCQWIARCLCKVHTYLCNKYDEENLGLVVSFNAVLVMPLKSNFYRMQLSASWVNVWLDVAKVQEYAGLSNGILPMTFHCWSLWQLLNSILNEVFNVLPNVTAYL